ncbi:phosphatase PAP2 family protein [Wohlfahrtiimonas chitiniclastica]|uniref:phosphatase PAP2 family protein n=2 Tax=Wohlfahrtiimonas chitiniclastica TaxID=400946 RepID=UPI001BCBBE8A|nr:phosphatase PAP2 family protein [Wohlfahrtiimonas chitiniclastica]MBS7817973.1 phosphatase PAP2 family protein [Wohlfahrtiimonas chitiniclastica]MBS7825940.1 phosphatase PAP2 family protein [Wohlfahrtiimonas chitiniclastica]
MLELSRKKITMVIILTLGLLIIPIGIILSGWHWQMKDHYTTWDHLLFLVTQSGTAVTYAFITCVVFASVLSVLARAKMSWVLVFFTAFILLVGTQAVKTGLKSFYKEPRPYTAFLVENHVDLESFYESSRADRKMIVEDVLLGHDEMPTYLKKHWAKETGYSFPSGHAAFAVCWLMLFVLILPMTRLRDYIAVGVIAIWSALMIISRLALGMHFPIDVLVSILYVPIICLVYAKISRIAQLQPHYQALSHLPKRFIQRA